MGDKDSPAGPSKDGTAPGTVDPPDGATPTPGKGPTTPILSEKDVESIAEFMLKKFTERAAEPKEKGQSSTCTSLCTHYTT